MIILNKENNMIEQLKMQAQADVEAQSCMNGRTLDQVSAQSSQEFVSVGDVEQKY